MAVWSRLCEALEAQPPEDVRPPAGRLGAALALLADADDGLEIVYTRRRGDLAFHPGQISLPGGRVEPGETVTAAAVREAEEEVGLDPASIEVLGVLPALYIPPSRYWLQTVVARWRAPHALVPAEAEVAEIIHARLSTLRDEATWRRVPGLGGATTWAWQLDDRHLLWGATGMVTTALLVLVDPDWSGGLVPVDLDDEREVRPWAGSIQRVPAAGPQRLPGVASVALDEVAEAPRPPEAACGTGALAELGDALAEAVGRLDERGPGPVLVLAGGGGNGVAGLAAARALAAAGADLRVVLASEPRGLVARLADGLADAEVFAGALPEAGVVVDALVGGGLTGALRDPALAVTLVARHLRAPVLSVDLPSGLHPDDGLVGEVLPAEVTVALGVPRPGLFHDGLAAFVGDLYVVRAGTLARVVAAPALAGAAPPPVRP